MMHKSTHLKQLDFIIFTFLSLVFHLVLNQDKDYDILGSSQDGSTDLYTVSRVVDGDTFVVNDRYYVRFIGIDSPELNKKECFAFESKEKLEELLLNKKVVLKIDKNNFDRYQRWLRYVYLGDQFINEILVKEGFARAKSYPPDTKYQDVLKQAEDYAKDINAGLWKECY